MDMRVYMGVRNIFSFIQAWKYVRRCAKEEFSDKEILHLTHKTSFKTIVKINMKSRVRKGFETRALKLKQKISAAQSYECYQN